MAGLARRRSDQQRVKARARRIGRLMGRSEMWATMNSEHLAKCSCISCGNPRRHYGNRRNSLTLRELRAEISDSIHDRRP